MHKHYMGASDIPQLSSSSIVEFRTNQCRALRGVFDALKDHIVDISFLFSKEGVKVMQFSGVHTFLVSIKLDADEFQHYYCRETEGYVEINVSLSNIHKIFKAINNEDNQITWIYKEDGEDDVLTILVSSDKKNEERQFDIRLQEPDEDPNQRIDIAGTADFPYSLTMPCADLQRICRDLKNMNAKYVDITYNGNSISFETRTETCSKCRIVRRQSDDDDADSNVKFIKTPVNCIYKDRFKFELINSFSKCAQTGSSGGGANVVRMLLNQGQIMILQFSIGTLGELNIAIAPYSDVDHVNDD